MMMHPELERALNDNVSALEMIKAFTKYHSGVIEGRIEVPPFSKLLELRHHDSSFWDIWQPLFRNVYLDHDSTAGPASEPFLSIHRALTKDIISWLCDSKRRSNVYLIAEAQTQTENGNENYRANAFATICHDARRFGLPLRNAPTGSSSIHTLCSTLAAYYPTFRRLLAKTLIDNPEIHQQPTRVRFKKLIHELWKELHESNPKYTVTPPVMVLRFSDVRYSDYEELLPLICEFSSSRHASSLLWIISFNPKLKLPVPDFLDSFSFPRLTRLRIDYDEARADTEFFLRHRFSILRRKHKEMFDEHEVWPSKEQMCHLTRVFYGVFDSIDVVDQFIDWEGEGGPKVHLETFLAYMIDSPSPSDEQPYCALYHFYIRASSNVPPNLLTVVNRILSSVYCGPYYHSFTSFQLACFLSVAQDTILDALLPVCRWAVISSIQDQTVFYSASPFFLDFLEKSNRSGCFMRKSDSHFRAYQASLQIASHSSNLIESMKPVGQFSPKPHVDETTLVLHYACRTIFDAYDTGTDPSHSEWTLLRRFDFRCLAYFNGYNPEPFVFFSFLNQLHAWDKSSSPNLVRVEPVGALDREFIDKCAELAEPLDLQEKGGWFDLHPAGPKYVLLGLEAGTVLVLLSTIRHQELGSIYHGYNVYTSTMLDDM